MVDRQDIDALLIGSLYGELSSADEARLQAHLESYPADRTALDRLTHARATVRRSRILEVQLDPPQSVSAMLLQEAARRAPRKVEAGEGWFARLRRSFLMHPAMAAAVMLVVVIGVAGTMYLRNGDHFAAPEVSMAERSAPAASAGAAAAPAPATPTAPDAVAQLAPAPSPKPDLAARQADEESGYRVGLVEGSVRPDKELQTKTEEGKPGQADAAETVAAPPAAKLAKKSGDAGQRSGPGTVLEVTTPRLQPKDLDDAADGRVAQAVTPAPDPAPPSGANRGFATPADPRPVAKEDSSATSRTSRTADAPKAAAVTTNAARDGEDAKLGRAPISGTAAGGGFAVAPIGGEDKGGAPEADVSWAKDQHSRLVTQVRAGRCNDAATTALALSNRAPGYYQQNVETDRALKTCLPLINNARELEAARAQRARGTKAAPVKAEPSKNKPAAASQRR